MDSKKLNCPFCGQLAAQLKEDRSFSYRQYDQLLQKLMELERQGDMELYAGDCPLEDAGAVLDAEQHYKPAAQEDSEINGDYDFYRPVIRVEME